MNHSLKKLAIQATRQATTTVGLTKEKKTEPMSTSLKIAKVKRLLMKTVSSTVVMTVSRIY